MIIVNNGNNLDELGLVDVCLNRNIQEGALRTGEGPHKGRLYGGIRWT